MADQSKIQTAISIVKFSFFLIGIISTVLLIKVSVPYSLDLFIFTLPRIWICFRGWLSPPYLYIVVNLIIITILASSSYHQKLLEKKIEPKEEKIQQQQSDFEDSSIQKSEPSVIWSETRPSVELPSDPDEKPSEAWTDICVTDSVRKSLTPLTENRRKSEIPDLKEKTSEVWTDASCVTDSVGKSLTLITENRRKSIKPSASSKTLGVSKPKKHDTLDATWKAITEGRGMPLTRHLKKSDTWEVVASAKADHDAPDLSARREMKKSKTFNDAASSASSRVWLRREMSLSQDELNRRVEAFIKKFNNEIRLQRQESYQKYMEMVNRGC